MSEITRQVRDRTRPCPHCGVPLNFTEYVVEAFAGYRMDWLRREPVWCDNGCDTTEVRISN